jgi:hypothetical protein
MSNEILSFVDNQNFLENQDLKLPVIPKDKRIILNDIIRSPLFNVSNHNIKRELIKDKVLFTFGDTHIKYRGEELRQDDEDVWLQILYLISKSHSNYVEFLPYTFLKQIGWPDRTQYREKLLECLTRMSATAITIKNNSLGEGKTVSLVRAIDFVDESGNKLKKWKVVLEDQIIRMFGKLPYSKIVWDQRMKLKPLAKWLHAFYSSHAQPYALKVSTIHAACGSKAKQMKHFKSVLKNSLLELIQVGFLEEGWVTPNDLVMVVRKKLKYSIVMKADNGQ